MRLLLVEDDRMIGESLRAALKLEGHAVDWVTDAQAAATTTATERFDLVLLDLGLPKGNGLDVLRGIRARGDSTPVIVLTARDALGDRVAGLDAGADDYLTKPFSTKELLARIRAVLRRKAPEALDSAVEVSGLRLDPATRRVTRGTQEVKIGPTEFRLLHFFMTHTERVHSRTQLLDRVWGDHVFIEERTVDVHVKRLREALAPVQCSTLIETVRGAGYRLTQQAAATSV